MVPVFVFSFSVQSKKEKSNDSGGCNGKGVGRSREMNEKLRRAVKRSGKSNYWIHDKTGISKGTLGRWKRGLQGLSLSDAELVAKSIRYKLVLEEK